MAFFLYECELYDKNTYTRELNGSWNVVIGIKHTREDSKKIYQAMYLFRHDSNYNETYGCPFYNVEYLYDLKHCMLNKKTQPECFKILEDTLIKVLGQAKKIDHFES